MPRPTTLVIAPTIATAQHVSEWIARNGDPGTDAIRGASRPVPQIPMTEIAYTRADQGVRALQGWVPRRIVIVDYVSWRTEPGGIDNLWWTIQSKAARRGFENGSKVIWW